MKSIARAPADATMATNPAAFALMLFAAYKKPEGRGPHIIYLVLYENGLRLRVRPINNFSRDAPHCTTKEIFQETLHAAISVDKFPHFGCE